MAKIAENLTDLIGRTLVQRPHRAIGISSGAVAFATIQAARGEDDRGKLVVV